MGDDVGKMSDDARYKAGITKTLPRSVQEALVNLDTDSKLVKELGQDFVKNYISVKEVSTSYVWR
jgi:glutamine synthetase